MTAAENEARARLRAAPWLGVPSLGVVFDVLAADEGTTRVVGGAVRDTLLGRIGKGVEIDLATVLLPEEVMARAEARGIAAVPTGIDFGTVTLVVNDRGFEVTTLRRDIETDGRHAVVRFGDDWTEDAKRRDFTLNALYCGPDGALFDPLDGLGDCLAKKVHFIGDANARIAEDRLRILRFFRFSASHGGERFDKDGLAACAAAARDLGPVSAERIGHEMTRILSLPKCKRTLVAMTEAGLLGCDAKVLARLGHYETAVPQPGLAGRLALLADDVGLDTLKTRWRLNNAEVRTTQAVRKAAALITADRLAETAYRFADVLDMATGVAGTQAAWSSAEIEDMYQRLRSYRPPEFPLSGALLLRHGFKPGPELGAALSRLETAWIESGFSLTREQLLDLAAAKRS